MLKLVALLFFFSASLLAEISLRKLSQQPTGRTKDFMIWQYLGQHITSSQADAAYAQVKGIKNNKIFYRYAKKTDDKTIKFKAQCKKNKNLLSIKDPECLKLAINIRRSLPYTNQQRKKIIAKLTDKHLISMLNIQNEPNTQKAYENYSADDFLNFFNKAGYRYRNKKLNIHLNKKFIDSLSCGDGVAPFIKIVVNTRTLYNLQKSLLVANGEVLDSVSNFFLAINHLKHKDEKKAIKFFLLSRKKALVRINRDKNTFWLYQVTKNKKYLKELMGSTDINIYTLYAHDLMGIKIHNYFSQIPTQQKVSYKSLTDPFCWDEIYQEIKLTSKESLYKLLEKYEQEDMKPVQAYILQKANDYNLYAYLMPYDKYLKGLKNDDKAIIYALMRQESQLIPSALSYSFAQGLMQMMPFVTNAISKEIKHPIKTLNEMFEPKHNLRYARHHLRWMQRSLYHPLFIAYAYNGGIGFFKSYLLSGKFKKGKYEPYLSMEMMSNTQSREYGKKVLANYVMYKKIMGEKISIVDLFDTLMKPNQTDRFRASK